MANVNEAEGLNIPKSNLSEFFDDVEGKLALLTGLVDASQFGLTLEQIRKPLLVIGPPGIGKTCGIIASIREMNKKLPKERKLGFKKILLGQTVVGSLTGIPVAKPDGSVVRIQIPDLPDPKRDGEYGVLFLDEITTADEMQIQPALGLADDSRSLGEYTLPEHWLVIGAGNGPDCTNFVRLDDMTLTRFKAYDVSYSFKTDWRPYAHKTNVSEDILAFLNFNPDIMVRVESTDMDSAGKMFPCPRTWERLSIELKMREAMGKPVSPDNAGNFAGRIVGTKAGMEFGAFMAFKKTLQYDAKKILKGKEKDPVMDLKSETFHIILQSIIKNLKQLQEETLVPGTSGDYPLDTYEQFANAFKWLLKIHSLDMRLNAIIEMRNDVECVSQMMGDPDFIDMCPEYEQFLEENAYIICTSFDEIEKLRV